MIVDALGISETGGTRAVTFGDIVWNQASGNLRLNAAGSYTGGSTFQLGRVDGGVAGAFGSGLVTITGGTLGAAVANTLSASNAITQTGGTLDLQNANLVLGVSYTFTSGTLSLRNNSSTTFSVGTAAVLNIGGSASISVNNLTTGSPTHTLAPINLASGAALITVGINGASLNSGALTIASDTTLSVGGGNDVAIYNVIPEPGSAIALLSGTALLLGLRRRRHA